MIYDILALFSLFSYRSAIVSERSESPEGDVKFDTVVTMIDSVTDEMTFFKEKV